MKKRQQKKQKHKLVVIEKMPQVGRLEAFLFGSFGSRRFLLEFFGSHKVASLLGKCI